MLLALLLVQGWEAVPRARLELQRPGFGYGVNVADLKNVPRVREMGFQWMKGFVGWDSLEPRAGEYDWTDLSKAVVASRQSRLGLLLRVDHAPEWSRPDHQEPGAPPDPAFLGAWGDMLYRLAQRGKGHVAAYEIWNEPNLASEWGGRAPDPGYYVEMLRIAYRRIKAADPGVRVVSAGLAPTQGDGGIEAVDNLLYLREMYRLGGGDYFDVLGSHPYGFGSPPDADPRSVASFRSVELEREIMLEFGADAKPVWATESGWLLDPGAVGLAGCREDPSAQGSLWQAVDASTQARYSAQAYRYAYDNWPWLGAIFIFNLDFATAPWYSDPCEPMGFYSLLGPDSQPRLGFEALKAMPKPGSAEGAP
ncbi:MAG: hypothetical protein Q7R39_07960 [Dehalococcoidia bacterium]|nr:hypothetical protein [Dehalococcoidia bacterium]